MTGNHNVSSRRTRKVRAALHEDQNGRCFWCGCETVDGPHCPQYGAPPNGATVDHLEDRNGSRMRVTGDVRTLAGKPVVLACAECNQRRGRKNQMRAQRRCKKSH